MLDIRSLSFPAMPHTIPDWLMFCSTLNTPKYCQTLPVTCARLTWLGIAVAHASVLVNQLVS